MSRQKRNCEGNIGRDARDDREKFDSPLIDEAKDRKKGKEIFLGPHALKLVVAKVVVQIPYETLKSFCDRLRLCY